MFRQKLFALLLVITCFAITGCLSSPAPEVSVNGTGVTLQLLETMKANASQILAQNTQAEINQNLRQFAPCLAKALTADQSLKTGLGQLAAQKTTGDYEVFYDLAASRRLSTKQTGTFSSLVTKANPGVDTAKLTANIPYLNIYIHKCADLASYNGEVYVLPLQYPFDDMGDITYTAYNSKGEAKVFSGSEAPDFPVVVIGISERVNMLYRKLSGKDATNTVTAKTIGDGTTMHEERMRGIYLSDVLEGWPLGAPEVYALYAVGNNDLGNYLAYVDVNDASTWYNFNSIIFTYYDTPAHIYYKIELWEWDYEGFSTTREVSDSYIFNSTNYTIYHSFSTGDYDVADYDDQYGSAKPYFMHTLTNGYTEYAISYGNIRLGY